VHIECGEADLRHRGLAQGLHQHLALLRRPAGHEDMKAWLARQPFDKSSPEEAVSADDQYAIRVHGGV
jgi:hypothetical protein